MPSAERYFVIGALSDYTDYPVLDGDAVTGEVGVLRETLTRLGYTEIEPPPEDRRGPRELVAVLRRWLREREGDPLPGGTRPGLLVYFTGHGLVPGGGGDFYLPEADATNDPVEVDTATHTLAFALAQRALKSHVVDDFLLLLDTCRSGAGARDVLGWQSKQTTSRPERPNLWIISASRELESARIGRFATAFRDSLLRAPGHRAEVDITLFVEMINEELGSDDQHAELVSAAHSTCGLLLDPQHMPTELPGLAPWTRYARGVEDPDIPGWYFCGRADVLTAVSRYLNGSEHGPLLLTGSRGSGRTSVLRWTQLCGTPGLWAAVPPIARQRAMRVQTTARVVYVELADEQLDAVHRMVATALGVPSGRIEAIVADPPAPACLLVDLSPTDVPDPAALEYLAALARTPGLRVVIAGTHEAVAGIAAVGAVDLDTAQPTTRRKLADYLTFRTHAAPGSRYVGRTPDAQRVEFAKIVAGCCESFDAAARACGVLVRNGDVQEAIAEAGTVLAARCLTEVAPERSRAWAVSMLLPFVFGRPVTPGQWAALASALSGQPRRADDVRFATRRLRRYLHHDERTDTWESRFIPRGSDFEVDPGLVRAALRTLVPMVDGGPDWRHADPIYLDLLAQRATGDVLTDPAFLLAAPSATVQTVLSERGYATLAQVWRRIRHHGGEPTARTNALALHAYAAGLTEFARRVPTDGLPVAVLWRQRSAEPTAQTARCAVDAGGQFAVTAGVDGSLTVWRLATQERIQFRPDDGGDAVAALAMATVDGAPVVVAAHWSGRIVLWDPMVRPDCWTVVDQAAEDVLDIAVDSDRRVAVVDGRTLRILDGRYGGALAEPATVPDSAAVAMSRRVVSVATTTGDLYLWPEHQQTFSVHSGQMSGAAAAVGLSADGLHAVWAARGRILVDLPGAGRTILGELRDDVTYVALSDLWVAASVSRPHGDLVRVWQIRTGRSWDIPLDDVALDLVFSAPDSLVVAMPSGLAGIRLG